MAEGAARQQLPAAVRIGRAATVPAYLVCANFTVVLPPLIALGLTGPAFLAHESLVLIAPVNLVALWLGRRRHLRSRPLVLGAIGVGLILGHMLLHVVLGDFSGVRDPLEAVTSEHPLRLLLPPLLIIGGVLLVVATVMDLRARWAGPPVDPAALEEHWRAILTGAHPDIRGGRRFYARIPSHPRCKLCNAPFGGMGGMLMRPLGKAPSEMNPRFCGECFSKTQLGGAEVELSMLFVDVRGSTTLAEGLSPSEFTRILNRFYTAATEVLVDTDALIDKLVGDEVIGLYVPGYAGPDHAQLAVQAAERLLRATGHADPDGPWLPIGVGVHTGVAFVGAVGSAGRVTDVTALGDAVNTTARLVSMAGPGEVLVSEAAAQAAGMDLAGLEQRRLELKGRAEPVEVHVLRVGPARPASAVQPTTPGGP